MHEIDHSVPLFFTRVRDTHIPITPQLVMDELRVPRDELMYAFYEHPSVWGEYLFTPC